MCIFFNNDPIFEKKWFSDRTQRAKLAQVERQRDQRSLRCVLTATSPVGKSRDPKFPNPARVSPPGGGGGPALPFGIIFATMMLGIHLGGSCPAGSRPAGPSSGSPSRRNRRSRVCSRRVSWLGPR